MIFYRYQMVNFALFFSEKRLKKGFGNSKTGVQFVYQLFYKMTTLSP